MEYMIYGAGFVGLHVSDLMRECDMPPIAIIDRAEALWGGNWRGIPIVGLKDVLGTDVQIVVCHSDIRICNAIIGDLKGRGFNNSVSIYNFANDINNSRYFKKQRNIIWADKEKISNNALAICTVENLLSDDKSKVIYRQIFTALRELTFSNIDSLPLEEQYFPTDIFTRLDNEVMVDVGGGPDGEVLDTFISIYNDNFAAYYMFDACNYVNELDKGNDRVGIQQIAIGNRNENVRVRNYMNKNALVSNEGDETVKCSRIDDMDFNAKISILKVDVEGMEKEVLDGAWNRIISDRPVIELATYHRVSDYWELPLMLHERLEDYRYYLRSYQGISETILYAVPHERMVR